jgi:hypothetical protein
LAEACTVLWDEYVAGLEGLFEQRDGLHKSGATGQ